MVDETMQRLKEAAIKLERQLNEKGQKFLPSSNVDSLKQVAAFLPKDSDKIFLISLFFNYIENTPEEKKAIDWAKEIYSGSQNKNEIFSSLEGDKNNFKQNLKIISQISPEAAQQFIDNSPLEYIRSKNANKAMVVIRPAGTSYGSEPDIFSYQPSIQSIENAVRKLPPL